MYCMKCGTEIEDDSVFCQNCGANIRPETGGDSNKKEIVYVGFGKNIEKIIGLAGGLMMLFSGYMDFVSIDYIGRYNFRLCERSEDWKILMILIVVAIAMIFIDVAAVFGMLATLAASAVSVFEIVSIDDALSGKELVSSMVSHESGYYFLMIGMVILVIGYVSHIGRMIRERR